jgi:hypothetical protein
MREAVYDTKQRRQAHSLGMAWLGIDLSFQNFDEEAAGVPGKYAPPDGRLSRVFVGRGGNFGCLALRFRPESTPSGPSVRP